MPTFAGVNHFALSVTDLDRTTRFYTEVLGLLAVLDFGHGGICLDRATGFSIGLIRHPGDAPGPYTELQPGLDHLGLTAASRDELVAWEQRFEAMHVTYSPNPGHGMWLAPQRPRPGRNPAGVPGTQRGVRRTAGSPSQRRRA